MDSIKFPNSHHARVNLVVKLKSEYGDQHVASVPNQTKAKTSTMQFIVNRRFQIVI